MLVMLEHFPYAFYNWRLIQFSSNYQNKNNFQNPSNFHSLLHNFVDSVYSSHSFYLCKIWNKYIEVNKAVLV